MKKNNNNLIWLDLEMTGLNVQKDYILEIATLITDKNLKILAEGPEIAIFQNEKILKLMNAWNINVHTRSGLIDRVQNSKFTNQIAENKTLQFLKKWVEKNKSPICGNSVSYDRYFLLKYMPKLESYFHYRCIDVSSIKEIVKRWKPKILYNFKKNHTHKAIQDIYASIDELLYYKKYFFAD